jgi:hypothetical protein
MKNLTYKGNHFKIDPTTSAIVCAPVTGTEPQDDDWCYVDLNLLADEDVEVLSQLKNK